MKRFGRFFTFGFLVCIGAALLVFAGDVRQAALSGLSQCACVLVPSLFPFCELANLTVELGYADALGRRSGRLMPRLFGVSANGAGALILGLVGGYPIGAQTVAELYTHGSITKDDAKQLSAFTNNAGPAFLVGMAGLMLFQSVAIGLVFYLIQICAAIVTGMLLRKKPSRVLVRRMAAKPLGFPAAFCKATARTVGSMLNICGIVTVFSVLLSLLEKLPFAASLPPSAAATLGGSLELTSGILALAGCSPFVGFITASTLLGWGGLCVHFQAMSALTAAQLPIGCYFKGKLLQALVSATLSVPVALLLFGG